MQTFAVKLYARANGIIATYTLLGLIVGVVAGLFIETALGTGNAMVVVGIAAVLFAIMGYVIGSGRAFLLKFQAQQALCQRQIEINMRSASGANAP